MKWLAKEFEIVFNTDVAGGRRRMREGGKRSHFYSHPERVIKSSMPCGTEPMIHAPTIRRIIPQYDRGQWTVIQPQ
jgi:hypothetical protein